MCEEGLRIVGHDARADMVCLECEGPFSLLQTLRITNTGVHVIGMWCEDCKQGLVIRWHPLMADKVLLIAQLKRGRKRKFWSANLAFEPFRK